MDTLLCMSQQDELRKQEQEWDKLQALRLYPEIRSLELYVTAVALGMQTAIETLLDYPARLPDLEMQGKRIDVGLQESRRQYIRDRKSAADGPQANEN